MGNVKQIAPSLGAVSSYDYDPYDRVKHETGAQGMTLNNASAYTYDSAGNLTLRETVTGYNPADPWNNPTTIKTRMTYDPLGYVLTRTQEEQRADGLHSTTATYGYDGLRNVTQVDSSYTVPGSPSAPAGQIVKYAYDGRNLVTSQIVKDQTGTKSMPWTYSYTDNGLRSTVANPKGTISKTNYDGHDRVFGSEDAFGSAFGTISDTTVDGLGNVIESRIKDKAGNLLSKTNYQYDAQNRLTDTCNLLFDYPYVEGAQYPGICAHTDYYADGKVWKERDALGGETVYEYDGRGMTSKVTDPMGNETVYDYDKNGNKIKDTVREKIAEGQYVEHHADYTYDDFNRLRTVSDPLGHTTTYDYDMRGNKIRETDAENNFIQYEYDDLNRLVRKTEQTGGETTFTYTPRAETETITDANGNVTLYTYDDFQRQTKTTYAFGTDNQVMWENVYDNFGNLPPGQGPQRQRHRECLRCPRPPHGKNGDDAGDQSCGADDGELRLRRAVSDDARLQSRSVGGIYL